MLIALAVCVIVLAYAHLATCFMDAHEAWTRDVLPRLEQEARDEAARRCWACGFSPWEDA